MYFECTRPGWVVPGAIGGVAFLTGLARLWREDWSTQGVALLVAGMAALALESWWRWPGIPGLVGGLLIGWGAARLAPGIRWGTAVPASLLVSAATVLLASAAIRAWVAKRL